jgi:hypothetical protein
MGGRAGTCPKTGGAGVHVDQTWIFAAGRGQQSLQTAADGSLEVGLTTLPSRMWRILVLCRRSG